MREVELPAPGSAVVGNDFEVHQKQQTDGTPVGEGGGDSRRLPVKKMADAQRPMAGARPQEARLAAEATVQTVASAGFA